MQQGVTAPVHDWLPPQCSQDQLPPLQVEAVIVFPIARRGGGGKQTKGEHGTGQGGWGAEMAGGQRRVGAGQGPCSAAWGRGGTVHVQCRDNAVWHSAGSMQCGAGAEPQNPGQEWPALPACRHSRLRKALTLLISSLSSLLELSTRALVWFALSRAACACIRASFAFPLASAT